LAVAAFDDEGAGDLLRLAGLLALRVAPRAEKVLATTTGLRLAFATTVRVVDGVHAHAAAGRAGALPAGASSLAGHFVHVVAVADGADGAEAVFVEAADFTGRHLDQRPSAFAVGEDGLLTSGAGDLAAIARDQLDVVNRGAERDAL